MQMCKDGLVCIINRVNVWVCVEIFPSAAVCVSAKTDANYHSIFKINITSILCSVFHGHDCHETCRYETEELGGLFDEIRKKICHWI